MPRHRTLIRLRGAVALIGCNDRLGRLWRILRDGVSVKVAFTLSVGYMIEIYYY